MVDDKLLERIVKEAKINSEDIILEIGSGNGALTKHIVGTAKKIICVEQDKRLKISCDNVEFYNENILDIIDNLIFDSVVANIPYHISEPLMIKMLFKKPKQITIVVSDTFAKKIIGESIIGYVLQEAYNIHIITKIDPISFNPQPKVLSALVVLEIKDTFGIMHNFYEHRTRKVKNYFVKLMDGILTKKEAKEIIKKEQFIFEDKALYTLSSVEFFELYDFLKNTIFN